MGTSVRILGLAAAVLSLLLLAASATTWHQSCAAPRQVRFDLTLYKSLWVWLRDGCCTMHLLSMPTKVASRTEHHASLSYDPRPQGRSLLVSSARSGAYHNLWIVFPLWLPTVVFLAGGTVPWCVGPLRNRRRRRNGWCVECGYNLLGNRSGRCPECGAHAETPHRRRSAKPAQAMRSSSR